MNKPFDLIEFYTFENEVWYQLPDGQHERLIENSTELIAFMLEKIEQFYPKAYLALCQEYEKCKPNLRIFRFRIVSRFCRCNFGNIDNIRDIGRSGRFNLECVPCPLRGECRRENEICHPEFDSNISDAELRVLKLWFEGYSKENIASELYLSIHTINNHIRNAFVRLDLHSKADFFRYAEAHNLFQ